MKANAVVLVVVATAIAGCGSSESDNDARRIPNASHAEKKARDVLGKCDNERPPKIVCRPRKGEWACRWNYPDGGGGTMTISADPDEHLEGSYIC